MTSHLAHIAGPRGRAGRLFSEHRDPIHSLHAMIAVRARRVVCDLRIGSSYGHNLFVSKVVGSGESVGGAIVVCGPRSFCISRQNIQTHIENLPELEVLAALEGELLLLLAGRALL